MSDECKTDSDMPQTHFLKILRSDYEGLAKGYAEMYSYIADLVRYEEGPGRTDRPQMIRAREILARYENGQEMEHRK